MDSGTSAPSALRALTVACTLLAAACTTTETVHYGRVQAAPAAYQPILPPASVSEIVAGLQSGRSQAALAAELRERGLRTPATESDLDLLLKNGADGELIEAVRTASASAATDPAAISAAAGAGVVTSPPMTIVHDYYGWYPWRPYGWYPWVPFSFGLWWHHDIPHRHRPIAPPHVRPHPPGLHKPSRPNWQAPGQPRPPQWQGSRPGRMLPGGTRQIKPDMPRGGINLPVKPSR